MAAVTQTGRGAIDLSAVYPLPRRFVYLVYLLLALLFGVVVAGFWNFRLVDEFGATVVAGHTIGGSFLPFALIAGGANFLFYWGISRLWPSLGRWGFQLGWYS
jgi:hypothetical protein